MLNIAATAPRSSEVFGACLKVIGSANEAIGGAVSSREHHAAADIFPICIQCELLIVTRFVGHHLVLGAMMDDELAVKVLKYRRIT